MDRLCCYGLDALAGRWRNLAKFPVLLQIQPKARVVLAKSRAHASIKADDKNYDAPFPTGQTENRERNLTMTTKVSRAPIRNGLRDISMDDFWKDPLIVVDILHQKLKALPIDAKKDPQFAKEMSTVLELLRAIGLRRYGVISLFATLDLFQAAHYFLLLGDKTPDSQDGGYKDDAEVLHRVFTTHETEIREFERWLQRQGGSVV
jgi:hypothetical protein